MHSHTNTRLGGTTRHGAFGPMRRREEDAMNDMTYALSYEVARERIADARRIAARDRLAREATRREPAGQPSEFSLASAAEALRWALGRGTGNSLPTLR